MRMQHLPDLVAVEAGAVTATTVTAASEVAAGVASIAAEAVGIAKGFASTATKRIGGRGTAAPGVVTRRGRGIAAAAAPGIVTGIPGHFQCCSVRLGWGEFCETARVSELQKELRHEE